ncbi:MAG: TonB-dependent receptor [Thermoanaerobaculia bacterium]
MLKRLGFLVLLGLLLPVTLARAADPTVVTGKVTTKEDGHPYPNATVSITELNLSAVTDKAGLYVLKVPAELAQERKVELRVSAPGLSAKAVRITLTSGAITQDFTMGFSFHTDVTVGSRAAGAEAEKAVPVDVITSEQIQTAKGTTETSQLIEALAPSFNFPRPTISDGTDSVRPATLRALGPDQLLVLVNGKRRHTSALVNVNGTIGRGTTGVDLNAIPAAALERVEILRDGAAAQYGSDAIAGVLNMVLRSGQAPFEVTLRGGTTTHSDGRLLDVTLTKGFALGRGSVNFTGEYRKRTATNRAGVDPRAQGSRDVIEQPSYHWGDADERDIIGFLNGSIPMNDTGDISLYFTAGGSRRDGVHGGNFRRALQTQNWPQIYPNGFLPLIEPKIVDASGTLGVRGVSGGKWLWDLSAQYGHNKFDFNITNSLNTSLGPTSQTEFYSGSLVFNQVVANLDVAREFDLGLAGPINFAIGAEFRRENYQEIAGELNSYIDGGQRDQFGGKAGAGAQVFPGFRPSNEVDASRNSVAAYLDIEGNVTSFLRLGLAGRFEHYSDFGNTKDVKLTARVEATKQLAFRGAASTGFRAPSLGQSNFSAVSTNFLNVGTPPVLTPFDVGTFRVDSALARALGAEDLRPENSVHFSGGFVYSPTNALDFTADYFNIAIRDRIVFSGNFTGAALTPILLPFGATGARFFTNAINTRTEGVEVTANYKADLKRAGILRFQASYARAENTITNIAPTPAPLSAFQAVLFDRLEVKRIECGQPRDNVRVTSDWSKGPLGAVVRAARYGSFCDIDNAGSTANDQTFSAKWLFDLELSYKLASASVGIGVDNIFDNFPDRQIAANSNLGIFVYPRNSPYGFNGRFVYARISSTF